MPAPPESTWDIELRVFVSSTFEGLSDVRDVLARRVFPRVRAHCEARGIAFTDIDLRWGVTAETIAQGKLIDYCFVEIERCNCFVGLLRDRYGTVIDAFPAPLLERYPWLSTHTGESITELEFRAGVLRADAVTPYRAIYRLTPASDEECDPRLSRLIDAVRATGLPLVENVTHEQLEEVLFEQLCEVADKLAAARAEKGDTTAARHGRFARSSSAFLEGREQLLARLDAYLENGGSPVALTGEPGIGKTALLAAWSQRIAAAARDLFVFHFVEVDSSRAGLDALLEHLLEAAVATGLIDADIPRERREIPSALPDWIYSLSERVRLLLVVDGVDLLDDRGGARELLWLPARLPDSARIVISFRPGRTTQAALERGYELVQLEGLSAAAQVASAKAFLGRYGKTLTDADARLIGESAACAVPAFLTTVLAELRFYADHRGVSGELAWYLTSGSLEALSGQLLSRLEEDRHLGSSGFVGQVLELVLGARRGLLEVELLDLLGTSDGPLPASAWVPLRQRLPAIISTEGGRLTPTSARARGMIERHFDLARTRTDVHARLADYFAQRLDSPRGREEAPWHARRAQHWTKLRDVWRQPEVLSAAAQSGELEQVRLDWIAIAKHTGESAAAVYATIVEAPWEAPDHAGWVADLLMGLGHAEAAHKLLVWLARASRFGEDVRLEVESHARLSLVQVRLGQPLAAMVSSGHAIGVAQHAADKRLEARATAEAARLFAGIDMSDRAIELYRDAATLFRELRAHFSLGSCLNDIGVRLEQQGDRAGALATYAEAERAFATAGSFHWVTRSRSHQATVRWLMDDRKGAIELWNKVAAAFRMLGDEDGLGVALANAGGLLAAAIDQADVALPWLSEADALFERRHDLNGRARVAYSRLIIAARQGVIEESDIERLIDLRRETKSLAALKEQLLALRVFVPEDRADMTHVLERAVARLDASAGARDVASPAATQTDTLSDTAAPTLGEDPFSGVNDEQLVARLVEQSALTSRANKAKRFDDALNHANVCMAIVQSLETHRPGRIDEGFLRLNAFNCQFNLVLILYKMERIERGLFEARGAAHRYQALLETSSTLAPEARDDAREHAEVIPDILEQLVELTDPADVLDAYRSRAATLKVLADAQPTVFLGRYGSALRGLSSHAHDANLPHEANGTAAESIEALQKAVELQGDTLLRELGFSMRYAIDSLGREDLREAYGQIVAREIQFIVRQLGLSR